MALPACTRRPPGPAAGVYSALVTNFEPDRSLAWRMADAGVDAFFRGANDLVVPTEGGWRVDPGEKTAIPGSRIGCFGPGGNLAPGESGAVHHVGFFSRRESVDAKLCVCHAGLWRYRVGPGGGLWRRSRAMATV